MWTAWWWLSGCGGPSSDGRPDDTDVSSVPPTAATGETGETDPSAPPNLLVVLLDDVGTDKIAAYGEGPGADPTPTLSALAAEGVLFRNAWATPICGPSRGSLLTGRYGRRYGHGENVEVSDDWRIPASERLLPALLAGAPVPYTSVALGKWHLAGPWQSPDYMTDPLDRGFLHAFGPAGNVLGYFTWTNATDGVLAPRSGYLTSATADDAITSIATLPEPWFVYLAFNAPHSPQHVPPDPLNPAGVTDASSVIDQYDAMLVALDLELGRVLASMDPAVRERTTIVAMGDNGTPSFAIEPPFDPDHGKVTLWEGGLNVPLIVAGAGVEARGVESPALVGIVDVTATLLELAGVDPLGLPLDGVSFRAQLADPAAPGREFVYGEYLGENGPPPWQGGGADAVRDDRYKLITFQGVEGLFDLQGRHDDGPNLLDGPLDAERTGALDRLRAERTRVQAAAAYEGP